MSYLNVIKACCRAQSGHVFKLDKLTIYKLGNAESIGVIGMYEFPRSIHKDFRVRECQCRRQEERMI